MSGSQARSAKRAAAPSPFRSITTREEDVVRLFDRAMSSGNGRDPADLVVFNAGNNQRIDFRDLRADQFEQFWRVDCFGGFLVGREAARRLVPLGRGTIDIDPFRADSRELLGESLAR
jgi:NAD(P)-dependent dehydrogenase (short-subunit alcohol dehydrogenase family)